MLRKNNAGFTLMEILIVVAIIAIMATLATLNWQNVQNRAKRDAAYAELKQISTAETWAHNDTSIFWSVKDLMSQTLPERYAYDTVSPWEGPIGPRLAEIGISLDTALWHGPYLSLQSMEHKLDAQGNPLDPWGHQYQLIFLLDTSSTFMMAPSGIPNTAAVLSFGQNGWPEYAIDTVDAAQAIYRYREITNDELQARPPAKRLRDDVILYF
jgi:prepilin-type N-terminal cleavage/methylation domain-containing protein